ncbi:4-phosphoerythronate dehydrogenase PdxB [Pseudomonas mangiferae]|uniref:Erythronate-4-phosphate dehydrogenase n=1 Tax=Pseudomonas mangiferae TaxID=2593654 RepID=A0A553GXZ4_9PSED|nr:4-phosphoerythronate dehydrogenase PdxB [Pseudomonas mangiferae]TRX74360.1 4-phosphoerythronate dehydrogenase PdxB [Pseudomonas mangiferae]
MRLLADENIPLVEAFFSSFAGADAIRRLPGRAIDRAALGDAEVLLVRSVTPVGRDLLEGSAVTFVGTCTIGTDHLDLDYLREAGIAWASAPGCNARGVVDYVLGSVLTLAEDAGIDPATRRYGVLGAGEVGGRLLQVLRGLGWQVRVCDPPRLALEGDGDYIGLEELLDTCDVISLHTPLDASTHHLLDETRLARLRPGAWLINASRGAVVDNQALKALLARRDDVRAVLDVWEGEPLVDVELARHCRLATPHIAGYSLDGKLRGTEQIYRAFCAHQGERPEVELASLLPAPGLAEVVLGAGCDPRWALPMLCRAVYDPRRDDADFRRTLEGDEVARRAAFDTLRKHYPVRREIDGLTLRLTSGDDELRRLGEALGSRVIG